LVLAVLVAVAVAVAVAVVAAGLVLFLPYHSPSSVFFLMAAALSSLSLSKLCLFFSADNSALCCWMFRNVSGLSPLSTLL
jgi:hypothetical protein